MAQRSRNLVLPYETAFKTPIVQYFSGIGSHVTATHAASQPIETLHNVSPLVKSFVALKAPEPILFPLWAVKALLPVFASA